MNAAQWLKLVILIFMLFNNATALKTRPPIETVAARDYFYIGGEYVNITNANVTSQYKVNQIYVERLLPTVIKREYPIIFIAGAGQTGTNFLNTPDGRPGWASFFLDAGYVVYLTDQPQRGRSPSLSPTDGFFTFSTRTVETLFTASSKFGDWPQSKMHTQWPGSGLVHDPVFDAFYASQVQLLANNTLSEIINTAAYTQLLDLIGPAVLIAHSQAGAFGWRIGDARPDLVKAIISIEPAGPPFQNPPPFTGRERVWGITSREIMYEPSAGRHGENLSTVIRPGYDEHHSDCELQVEPPKRLVNLSKIPVVIVTGEASFHQPYEYCTVDYLRQAGVETDFLDLGKRGIHGNGHMLFMEKNNIEIAQVVSSWLDDKIKHNKSYSISLLTNGL